MTDDEFLGYVRIHCETERHLFTAGHAKRLLRLAGYPSNQEVPALIGIDRYEGRWLANRAAFFLRNGVRFDELGNEAISGSAS